MLVVANAVRAEVGARALRRVLSLMHTQIAAYGTWESPVTSTLVTQSSTALSMLRVDAQAVYWLELRPHEGGRTVLVCWTADGGARDVSPASSDVGSRVHEYGGGAYAVAGGTLVFSERSDNSVWLLATGTAARRIRTTPDCRYADFEFDQRNGRVYAVREDHRPGAGSEALTTIVVLDYTDKPGVPPEQIVAQGATFYSSPRLAPAGDKLAWIEWDHPNMPWDDTRLGLASVTTTGTLEERQFIVEGRGECVSALAWSAAGTLYFVSDRTNWWNVYALEAGAIHATCALEHDIGRPPWVFGTQPFSLLDDGGYVCTYIADSTLYAGVCDNGRLQRLEIGPVKASPVPFGSGVAFIAAPFEGPAQIRVLADVRAPIAVVEAISAPAGPQLDPADVSVATEMRVPTTGGETCFALVYPPKNARLRGPANEKPPLIVTSHGGPTSMNAPDFSLAIQWWTTRGFAVADVNYRGSSGYGRVYRGGLAAQWGVVDVADCAATATYLAQRGLVDPQRVAIRGHSASGFTALAALVGSTTFKAAASHYGVTDLGLLAAETHKFESRYCDALIGPWPAASAIYRARSPLTNAGQISAPVIVFAGLEDRVVPPNQASQMVTALRAAGVRVEHHEYAGEGHGFRQAETIRHSMEAELAFFSSVFALER